MILLGRQPLIAKSFAKVGAPLDRALVSVTRGRLSILGNEDFPQVDLTVLGRKSGIARTVRLVATPLGDQLVLIGSNFGQDGHPAWALNLEAALAGQVEWQGASYDVVARMVTDDDERERCWAEAAQVYPGYADYRRRVTTREIKMFVLSLTPTERPTEPLTSAAGT